MLAQLNRGKYGADLKKSLFSLKNQNEMWRLHTVLETNRNPRYNSHFSGYGLGWFLTDVKGNLKVSHSGLCWLKNIYLSFYHHQLQLRLNE